MDGRGAPFLRRVYPLPSAPPFYTYALIKTVRTGDGAVARRRVFQSGDTCHQSQERTHRARRFLRPCGFYGGPRRDNLAPR